MTSQNQGAGWTGSHKYTFCKSESTAFSTSKIADTRQMLRCDRIGPAVPAAAADAVVAA